MEALMREAVFPEEAIAFVLDTEKRLAAEGKTAVLDAYADKIMKDHLKEDDLRGLLKEIERRSEEMHAPGYTLDLLVLLRCWQNLKGQYAEKELDPAVFTRSLYDLRYKLLECRQVKGVWGVFVGWWYDGFFDLTRFALGRLQFELRAYEGNDYTDQGITVKKGDPVINMHIPSAGPLLAEDADASFNLAVDWFRETFPEGPVPFVMDSWLLDPDMMALLPEGNIKAFVNRFNLQHFEKNDVFEDGWRVFGAEAEKAPEDLPRKTGLQKAIADALASGTRFGEGYGVFVWPRKR